MQLPGRNDNRPAAVAIPAGVSTARGQTMRVRFRFGWLAATGRWLAQALALEADRRRLFLWLPVAYGAGIIAYFAADIEPAIAASLLPAGLFCLAAIFLRHRATPRAILLVFGMFFLGFLAGTVRTSMVAHPVLAAPASVAVTGRIVSIERLTYGSRLVMEVASVEPAIGLLKRIRVVYRGSVTISSGVSVSLRARLTPPAPPAVPGGYDFQREAYFQSLSAVGTATALEVIAGPLPTGLAAFEASIDRMRNALTERIVSVIGGSTGAIAAALVTGKRGGISEQDNDSWRAAGIYHIISISGLHMALAAGLFFWIARISLAPLPSQMLPISAKKCAAVIAMAGAVCYYLFSGRDIAAERSVIMTLVMLGAILVDRPALAMRNLAISGLIVMTIRPETVLGPSFQMSFSAVAGLVAYGEAMRRRREAGVSAATASDDPPRRIYRLLRDFAATSVVAGLCTAPFQAYHFHRLNPYGLLGNSIAIPVCSFLVMPAALAGVVLYPLGLDAPAWWAMGKGIALISDVAVMVARIQGAIAEVGRYPALALGVIVAGLACLTLMTTRVFHVAAVALLLTGAILASRSERPLMILDGSGQAAMLRGDDGRLIFVGARRQAFSMQQWLSGDRDPRRSTDPTLQDGRRCDSAGCTVEAGPVRLAVTTSLSAFADDCERASVIVTTLVAPADCWNRAEIFDRRYFERYGATYIYGYGDTQRLETARNGRQSRPWIPKPRAVPPQNQTAPADETDLQAPDQ